jgi:hypothetical protein
MTPDTKPTVTLTLTLEEVDEILSGLYARENMLSRLSLLSGEKSVNEPFSSKELTCLNVINKIHVAAEETLHRVELEKVEDEYLQKIVHRIGTIEATELTQIMLDILSKIDVAKTAIVDGDDYNTALNMLDGARQLVVDLLGLE